MGFGRILCRAAAQRPVFGLPVDTRLAGLRKQPSPPTRARRAVAGVLTVRSTHIFNETGVFSPCCVFIQFLHLPVIVLLECSLNRSDGEAQIAVARFSILHRNHRWLGDEQSMFFE